MTDRQPSVRANRLDARDRLAFLLVWLPYAVLVRRFWFVADDAYISFRYSRNWGRGLGLVYNPGESPPTEGYSNFLMVAAGALVEALGLDMQLWLPVLCAVSGSVLLYAVFRAARVHLGASRTAATLATAFLGLSPPFAVWSTSGLEAMPYALLFFLVVERLCLRPPSRASFLLAGVLACLMAMTRVEGIAWAAVVFPALALVAGLRRPRPPIGAYAVALVVGYGVYFALRWSYFGHPWPMTVYAKVGFTAERVARGADYVWVLLLTCPALFALLPALVSGLRRGPRGIALAALPPGVIAYTLLVGGDWMAYGRFLLPALGLAALLVALLLEDLRTALGSAACLVGGGTLAVLSALPGLGVELVPEHVRARHHFRLNTDDYRGEHAQWEFQRWNGIRWSTKGEALAALGTPDASIVMGAIGAASYVSDLFTLDRHGFVTPAVALREVDPAESELRSPGHDKVVPERWFVDHGYAPTYLRAKLHDAATREALLDQLETSAARLRRTGVADRYVLDFAALSYEPDAEGRRWFLFLWVAIPNGVGEAAAWAELDRRTTAFRRDGDVRVLDVAPPDAARVPGLPSWL